MHLEPLELEIVTGSASIDDEVRILDLSFEKDPVLGFENAVRSMHPDLVGFTGYSSHSGIVKRMAVDAKRINPKILTVVGGTHATIIPADYAKDGIDLIVRGEGGTAMREILRRHREGLPLHFDHTYPCCRQKILILHQRPQPAPGIS